MAESVTLTAQMLFKAPVGEEEVAALAQLVAAVRREPGCLGYTAHLHAEDPRRVLFYECWSDNEALAVHAQGAALVAFRAAMEPRLSGPSVLDFWRVVG